MNIYFDLEALDLGSASTAVALGTFDGLHIGHLEVLRRLKASAERLGVETLVYTFSNHPKDILTPESPPPKIMDIDEKVQIFTHVGLDHLVLMPFTRAQMAFEPEDFIKEVLVDRLHMKHLTVGYDYRFGKRARGDVEMLKSLSDAFGYTYEIVEPIEVEGVRVSSTLIRELLSSGDIERANRFLGRRHFIKGTVQPGKGRGAKQLGVGTANLPLKKNISTLCSGVYITETIWGGKSYPSVTNIGWNPTFEDETVHLETHLLDVSVPLYGETLEIYFIKRLRDELKFDSIDALVAQMAEDIEHTRAYFEKNFTRD